MEYDIRDTVVGLRICGGLLRLVAVVSACCLTLMGGCGDGSGAGGGANDLPEESVLVDGARETPENILFDVGGSSDDPPSSLVKVSGVPWISQLLPGQSWKNNANCGPVAYLMIEAYHKGFTPTTDDIRSVVEWVWGKCHNNYDGKATTMEQLADFAGPGRVCR